MWYFLSGFPDQYLDSFIIPTMRAVLAVYHILHLINLIYLTFREKYNKTPRFEIFPCLLKVQISSTPLTKSEVYARAGMEV
jgi:hypothetical protein